MISANLAVQQKEANWTIIETSKGWRFVEKVWYCHECGVVTENEVNISKFEAETGNCRCGNEISKTTF